MKNNSAYQIEKENDEKNLNYVAQLVNNNDFPEEAKKVVIDNVNAAIEALQSMRKIVYKALGIEGIKLQYRPHDVLKSNEKNITNPLELKSMAHKIAQIIDHVKNQNAVAPQIIINDMDFKKFPAAESEEFNKERNAVLNLSNEIIDEFATKYEGPDTTLNKEVERSHEEIMESQDSEKKLAKAELEEEAINNTRAESSNENTSEESNSNENTEENNSNSNESVNENESSSEESNSNGPGNDTNEEGAGNENNQSSNEETQG